MQRRTLMLAGLIQTLYGCTANGMGLFKAGENAGYGATNVSPYRIQDVEVVNASNGHQVDGESSAPPNTWKPSAAYPKYPRYTGGNNLYPADTGRTVPEEVIITWRSMPPAGGKPYTGQLHGPFRLKVRSRIPAEVLRQIRKEGVTLRLGFTAGLIPPIMQWDVVNYKVPSDAGGQMKILAQGGDEFPDVPVFSK
jgi:hypothetical protein